MNYTKQRKYSIVSQSYPIIIPRSDHRLSRKDISEYALKVLYRLKKAGYAAYLVGGGVRDLLLGGHPKDFDVATDATPEEVKKLFGNCRLIGRRFRLAHVFFGREIIEVATFRAGHDNAEEGEGLTENGMILRDNVFGTLEEDAWRRDFTVNALYYNIDDFSVVDYTGGMADLESRSLRMIGDPLVRLQEDPVRMLRAIRFSAKLGFSIEPQLDKAIRANAERLDGVPAARLFEEVLKLFLYGHALASYQLLKEYDLFKHLFAQTAASLNDLADTFIRQALMNTDERIQADKPVTPAFLYAALLWPAVIHEADNLSASDLSPLQRQQIAAINVTSHQQHQITIPKRFAIPMREIWGMQERLLQRKGKRPLKLLVNPRFRAGYDFMLLRLQSGETALQEDCDWWTQLQSASEQEQLAMCRNASSQRRQSKSSRPKRRRGKKTQRSAHNETL